MTINTVSIFEALEAARLKVKKLSDQIDETSWLKPKDKKRLTNDIISMNQQLKNLYESLEIFEGHLTAAEEGWDW